MPVGQLVRQLWLSWNGGPGSASVSTDRCLLIGWASCRSRSPSNRSLRGIVKKGTTRISRLGSSPIISVICIQSWSCGQSLLEARSTAFLISAGTDMQTPPILLSWQAQRLWVTAGGERRRRREEEKEYCLIFLMSDKCKIKKKTSRILVILASVKVLRLQTAVSRVISNSVLVTSQGSNTAGILSLKLRRLECDRTN